MTNNFFSLFKPYFDSFDNGNFFKKPITILYTLFGLVNLLVPFYSLYLAINNNFGFELNMSSKDNNLPERMKKAFSRLIELNGGKSIIVKEAY